MKAKIFFSLCFLLFISCNSSTVYSKFDKDFEDNRWQKSDAKTYQFTIEDEAQLYNLIFKFSHVYDYQFATIPINFSLENPSGETENFAIDLKIKDASGKELGDCAGDICDLSQPIKNKIKFEKGSYKVIISHNFKSTYLPNVLGIGLEVEKTE